VDLVYATPWVTGVQNTFVLVPIQTAQDHLGLTVATTVSGTLRLPAPGPHTFVAILGTFKVPPA
jgi:hypothetical protein